MYVRLSPRHLAEQEVPLLKNILQKEQKKNIFCLKNSGEFFPIEPANPLSGVVSLLEDEVEGHVDFLAPASPATVPCSGAASSVGA